MSSSAFQAPPVLTLDELIAQRDDALRDYEALVRRGLSLDLTRGKPSARQLDLASRMLTLPSGHKAADGTDCRNYGGLQGLSELRAIFSGALQVPVAQLVAAGNSSLSLMHDSIVHAMLGRLPGAERRWADEPRIAFLCPVPGYDRHFALCERFGIELIPVPMTDEGPDMDVVERLVPEDPPGQGDLVRAQVQQPQRCLLRRRDRRGVWRPCRRRPGFPDLLGQRLRRTPPHGHAGGDRRSPGAVRGERQSRPGLRLRLHLEDHFCRWGRRLLRLVRGQRGLAARIHRQAHHRPGQDQPAPSRASSSATRTASPSTCATTVS